MAKAPTFSLIILLLLSLLVISLPTNSHEFSTKLSKREMGMIKREKLTHLHFYLHNILRGDATAVVVVLTMGSTGGAGCHLEHLPIQAREVVISDDRLTEGPNLSSRVVGRAQGMFGSADVSNVGFLTVLNFVFTEGGFNSSTLSVLGRYQFVPLSPERELPVIGGSGVFRFARGYARMRTYLDDLERGIVVDEYDVYVFHY